MKYKKNVQRQVQSTVRSLDEKQDILAKEVLVEPQSCVGMAFVLKPLIHLEEIVSSWNEVQKLAGEIAHGKLLLV